jgi:dihydrofolate synthase/folylpolyglutamate synthase
MLNTKDANGFLKPFVGRTTAVYTVPLQGDAAYKAIPPSMLKTVADSLGMVGMAMANVQDALITIKRGLPPGKAPVVLITGSLYLAGEVLAASGLPPA